MLPSTIDTEKIMDNSDFIERKVGGKMMHMRPCLILVRKEESMLESEKERTKCNNNEVITF